MFACQTLLAAFNTACLNDILGDVAPAVGSVWPLLPVCGQQTVMGTSWPPIAAPNSLFNVDARYNLHVSKSGSVMYPQQKQL